MGGIREEKEVSYKKWGGLLVLTGEDPDNYRFFLPIWLRRKRDQRREHLLRKWSKTYYFKQRSINEKFECEFLSLTPNDGKWHHMSMSVLVWVKKEKPKKSQKADSKMAEVQVYNDGVMVGDWRFAHPKEKKNVK